MSEKSGVRLVVGTVLAVAAMLAGLLLWTRDFGHDEGVLEEKLSGIKTAVGLMSSKDEDCVRHRADRTLHLDRAMEQDAVAAIPEVKRRVEILDSRVEILDSKVDNIQQDLSVQRAILREIRDHQVNGGD